MNPNYKLLFVKKMKSECSVKGSLYRGGELLSESRSWLYEGGEREFISGLGYVLSSIHGK